MPVPALLSDLTIDPTTNSPAGTESAKGVVDDYLRAHGAFIAQLRDIVQGATATLPSAATVNVGFAKTINVAITGTTTISAFDNYAEGTLRYVVFQGAMTLTHNAAVLVLPGAANIVTVSGDVGVFKSNGAGKWTCLVYQPAAGNLNYGGTVNGALTITGNATVNGRMLLADGTAAAPSIVFASDTGTDTGFYRISEGVIGVTCNGVAVGAWKPTGLEAIKVTQTT